MAPKGGFGGPFWSCWCPQGVFGAFLGFFVSLSRFLGPFCGFGVPRDVLGPFWDFWGRSGTFGVVLGLLGLFWGFGAVSGFLGVREGRVTLGAGSASFLQLRL